jgi:putative tryptophan/tyrosine transport system substrate-binding protein
VRNRRNFMTLLGGAAAAWPVAARAQQGERTRRVGVLMTVAETNPEGQARAAAFRDALEKLGWTDRRNIRIDYRWGTADPGRIRTDAADLVGLKPEVVLAAAPAALAALQQTTRMIPIVFAQVPDPVGSGFVASLAHPGGNITGFTTFEQAIAVKWLELLKQIAPQVDRVAVINDVTSPTWMGYLREIDAAAPLLGVQLIAAAVHGAAEIERAVDELPRQAKAGLIVLPGPVTTTHRDLIISLAEKRGLPTVYPYRYFVTNGGLASYGIDDIDVYGRVASYVDRILKGEKPAELPIQQPTKFELVINLKTAKALGLEIPVMLLARTDEVIE